MARNPLAFRVSALLFSLALPLLAIPPRCQDTDLVAREVREVQAEAIRKIEPALLAQLNRDAPSDLMVEMRDRADLTPAFAIADWEERGRFVYAALRGTAEASQARVRACAEARGLPYRSFFSSNCVLLKAGRSASSPLIETAMELAALPEVALVRAPRVFFPDPAEGESGGAPETAGWNLGSLNPAQGQYGMQAQQVWSQYGVRGEGIVVASIDTGVTYQHEALDRQYRGNLSGNIGGPYNHDYNWYDLDGSRSPCDGEGHGTGVTGIMVGENPGKTEQTGVAPGARWIACNGCPGACPEEYLNACADWMLAPCPAGVSPGSPSCDPDRRPHIINNSWGGEGCSTFYLDRVEAWRAAGIFPAFSAGNDESCNSLGHPGSLLETFASGAHDASGANLYAGGPSCQAPAPTCGPDDHQVKPNLNAPSVVRTAGSAPGGYRDGFNGTSGASPHTAGAVALLWSANPAYTGQIGETYKILEQSANHGVPSGHCGKPACTGSAVYPNFEYGWGYLDALSAIQQATAGSGTLAGTVTTGGQPLSNTEVTVQGTSSHRDYSTDAQGHYTAVLLAGNYTVSVKKYLYLTQAADVQITEGQTATKDFAMVHASAHEVSGTVTEARTGTPLLAEIAITGTPAGPPSPGDQIWTDPATGAYRITLAEGNIYTFAVRAGAGGYQTASRTFGPLVADRTEDFALASWVVSGTVTDARTHWPLYARITVTGTPAGPPAPDNEFWTDPSTGVYSIKLAEGNTYTLAVAARTAGYKAGSSTFGPLAADRTEDFSLAADEGKCAVPGYSFTYGFLTDFEATDGGFAGGGANSTWLWGPPGSGPSGGHSGAKCWGTVLSGSSASSWASSGDIDLSAAAGHAIVLTWWDWFRDGGKASVHSEVSKDGGVSWDNPWDFSLAGNWNWTSRSATLDASYAVPNFRARFVFSSSSSAPGASYWVDDVFVAISCDPGAGGIVAGMVTDKNSGVPVNAAAVAASSGSATSGADGFYTLYLPGGPASLTASKAGAGYGSVSGDVAVVPGSAVIHDFALPAANLSCQDWVKVTVGLGQKVEVALALTNEGEQPVRFRLMEGASQVAPGGREPLPEDCSGTAPDLGPVAPGAGSPRSGVEEGWQAFTQIPTGARNSFAGVSCDGQSLYAFGGIAPSGAVLNESWEYYPSGDFWCPLAPMPKALYGVDAACLGGRVYVVGGYDGATYSTDLQTYDTATDTWTSSPAPVPFNPMAAGYGGKLYTFGGYRKPSTSLLRVKETWSYDPSTRVWAQWAEMPIANVVGKAVTVGDFIYQIGGSGWGGSGTKMVQRFDPAANAWDGTGPQLLTGRTSPMAAWYGDALYVLGGWDSANVAPAGSVETYDPALWPSGAWTAKVQTIPVPVSNMAGACAASRIWLEGGRDTATTSVAANQALDDGGTCHFDPSPGLPWLSESLTAGSLAPGESQSAMLAFDAGVPEVPGTGTYQGLLKVATDSPGGLSLVTVRMEVVAFTCALDCLATVPASGQAGVPLSFSAVATPSGCSGEPSFAWTFGDGTSTAEQNPSKVYSDDGAYTWTMTASIQGVSCSQSGTVSVTSPVTKPGDCNGDGTVSIGEVQKAINMFLGTLAPDCGADFNGDGSVSIGEVQKVINGFLGHATSA